MFDEYESKLNTANCNYILNDKVKINEILIENQNLIEKIKTLEDTEIIKKSYVESLEKIKLLDKTKDGIEYFIKSILVKIACILIYNHKLITYSYYLKNLFLTMLIKLKTLK